MTALEFAIDTIETLTRDEDDNEGQDPALGGMTMRNMAVPELKVISWKEWTNLMGKPTPNHHYAIEALAEEPIISRQTSRLSATRNRIPAFLDNTASSALPSLSRDRERPGVPPLPERIRINSVAAKRIFNAICENLLRFDSRDYPLILLRPFYLLVHVEQDISDRMSELERDLVGKEVQLTENAREETERLRGDDRFPEGLIFRLGTDRSKLTLDESKEAVNDFRCLVSFIDDYINPLRAYFKYPKLVRFQELWYLFPLGSLIYVKEKSIPQKIWKVIQARGGRKYLSSAGEEGWEDKYSPFILNCCHLDYDGSKFVRVFHKFEVDRFTELQLVSSLPIVPLSVAEREHTIELEACTTRGKQFLACTKPSYLFYEGRSLNRTPEGVEFYKPSSDGVGLSRVHSEIVESQVMVDFERALQAMPDWSPAGSELERISMNTGELDDPQDSRNEKQDDDGVWADRIEREFLDKEEEQWQNWDKSGGQPSRNDLLLFPERVFAFVFRTRSWGKRVSEIHAA